MRTFILLMVAISLLVFTTSVQARPTDQECKLDPRKEGCEKK